MLKSRLQTRVENHMERLRQAMVNSDIMVLVGFPSGLAHVETTHEVNPETGERTTGTRQGGDLAELAEKLHYGTADIPARPFLEDGLNENQEELRKELAKELERLKTTGKANLDKIGTLAVGRIQEMVLGGYYGDQVPNAPLTIYLKGSDTPLVDGANMINSLRYLKVQNGKVMS
jgi:hypothetical protein